MEEGQVPVDEEEEGQVDAGQEKTRTPEAEVGRVDVAASQKRKHDKKEKKTKKKREKKAKKKKKKAKVVPEEPPDASASRRPVGHLITVLCNDRLGRKVRVKCNSDDTIGDFKKVVAAQIGTKASKIKLMKWHNVFKDHITLDDYEVHNGFNFELYYI